MRHVPDWITAYHEAAHAVTAEYLEEGTVDFCTIDGCLCGHHEGWTILGEVCFTCDLMREAVYVPMLYASRFGVGLVEDPDKYAWTFNGDDRNLLEVERVYAAPMKRYRRKAEKLVKKLAPQIHTVAGELLQRPTISGAEVRGLM